MFLRKRTLGLLAGGSVAFTARAADSDSSKVYRVAGLQESYHITCQNIGFDTCVVVAARFSRVNHLSTSPSENEELNKKEVYQAVINAPETHAAFSARAIWQGEQGNGMKKITKADKEVYVFERREHADLEEAVHFIDETDGSNPAEDIAISNEDENLLIFAWHHCRGDGQSGIALFRSVLEGLNDDPPSFPLPSELDPKVDKFPTDRKLIPRPEELMDSCVSLRTLLVALAGLVIPSSCISTSKTRTCNQVLTTVPPHLTHAELLSVPSDRVYLVLAPVRKHQITALAVLNLPAEARTGSEEFESGCFQACSQAPHSEFFDFRVEQVDVTWGKDIVDDAFAEAFVKQLTDAVDRLDRESQSESGERTV
ncbi:hypothetical protein ACEPAI_3528 [Sanghuangporus weigelae]